MGAEEIIAIAAEVAKIGKDIVTDKDVQRFLVGTYSDGRTRNLRDAIDGDYLSPKQKHKATKKKKKKKTKFKL